MNYESYIICKQIKIKAYCIDVAVMHDYVKSIRDTYFPVLDGPREHNRSYNYDGAPTDDSVVEFVGTAPEWVNDGYQIVEVIVYD